MASIAGSFALLGFGMFSVIEKASGDWIGRVGPWMPEGWPGTEVGWGLARHTWGKGYATEAAAAAIDWAFETLGWREVIHCIHPDNTPSQKVAQRLGSRILREGKLPAPLTMPIEIWGQSAEDWRARKTP
jgi:RimJ/RimL family protein N-acetyltransferase